jgi:hypothetical protein
MHRQPRREPDVVRQREAQTVARPVADTAFTDEAISPVEKLGRAQARRPALSPALVPALGRRRFPFRRLGPVGDLAAPGEFAAELRRRLWPSALVLALDPDQQGAAGGAAGRLA